MNGKAVSAGLSQKTCLMQAYQKAFGGKAEIT